VLGRHVVDNAARNRSLNQADDFTYTVGSRHEVDDLTFHQADDSVGWREEL
jgi:hypothetical protein